MRRTLVLVGLLLTALAPSVADAQPPPEAALGGVASVSAGWSHACAVLANGTVRCWGENTDGQLGNGTTNPATGRVLVRLPGGAPLGNVAQVSAGGTLTCARLDNGQARCWGDNGAGQLGHGDTTPSPRPVVVRNVAGTGPLVGVRQIVAGHAHACALLNSGQVRCWGDNRFGQTGDHTDTASWALPQVTTNVGSTGPLTGATQISSYAGTTCARQANGQAVCWGVGTNGQLGNGSEDDTSQPTKVQNRDQTGPLTGVRQIAIGEDFGCAVLGNGGVRCWGRNESGQVGIGAFGGTYDTPRTVVNGSGNAALSGAISVASGSQFTCVGVAGGQLRCWGYGASGQLGNGLFSSANRPVPVKARSGAANLTGVTQYDLGGAFTCARVQNQTAACWGHNAQRQLGNGGTANRPRPVLVQA